MTSRSNRSMTGTTGRLAICAHAGPLEPWLRARERLGLLLAMRAAHHSNFRVGVRADAGWRAPFVAVAPRVAKETQLHTTAVLGRWRLCGAVRLLACGCCHARGVAHTRGAAHAHGVAHARGAAARAVFAPAAHHCVRSLNSVTCTAAPRHGYSTLHALACALIDAASALACATGAAAPEDGGVVVHGVARGCLSKRTLPVTGQRAHIDKTAAVFFSFL